MIEINLLPGARKKSPSRGPSVDLSTMFAGVTGRLKDPVLIGTVAACVLSVAALGVMYVTQSRTEEKLLADEKQAQADSVNFSAMFAENTRVTATRDTLMRQLSLIKSIDHDRYIWPHILEEVSRALPQYTWVTSLGLIGAPQGQTAVALPPPPPKPPEGGPKLPPSRPKRIDTLVTPEPVSVKILGNTVELEAIPRFMRQLELSPFLENIVLGPTVHGVDQGKDITKFELTVTYSRPDTSQVRRVPFVMRVR